MSEGNLESLDRIVFFENGTASLRDPATGEPMHSAIGPWEEAKLLYVRQSELAKRLTLPTSEPLILHDIGMGIAANAICALETALSLAADLRRPLEIHSFESDLSGLRLALRQPSAFPWLAPHAEKAEQILRTGRWESAHAPLLWRLWAGDYFGRCLSTPSPEILYYDFHSPSRHPEPWTYASFRVARTSCAPRLAAGRGSWLFTYCSSKAARSAMLLAGWAVGQGVPTSMKADTTIATTAPGTLRAPLDAKWLESLRRSPRPLPSDCPEEDAQAAFRKIERALEVSLRAPLSLESDQSD